MSNAPAGWYPDTAQPGHSRYWDGQSWTQRVQTAATEPAAESPETPGTAWWKRRWVSLVVVAAVALAVGVAAGGSSAADSNQAKVAAERAATGTRTDLKAADAKLATAESEIASAKSESQQAQSRADNAVSAAKGNLKGKYDQLASDRKTAERAIKGKYAQLASDRRVAEDGIKGDRQKLVHDQQAFSAKVSSYNANSIPGDGTFMVGKDFPPGIYRAAASPDSCYWARLKSLDTTDIADNTNTTGPTTVEVLPSDRAFQLTFRTSRAGYLRDYVCCV